MFSAVAKAIGQCAFVTSALPVVLSLEVRYFRRSNSGSLIRLPLAQTQVVTLALRSEREPSPYATDALHTTEAAAAH